MALLCGLMACHAFALAPKSDYGQSGSPDTPTERALFEQALLEKLARLLGLPKDRLSFAKIQAAVRKNRLDLPGIHFEIEGVYVRIESADYYFFLGASDDGSVVVVWPPASGVDQNFRFRLKSLREALGWNQRALARKIHTPAHHVSELESGHVRPKPAMVARLAQAMGATDAWLAQGIGQRPDALITAERYKTDALFSKRLRELRHASGLSTNELRTRSDIPLATIEKMERGERVPTVPELDLLAKALGANKAYLAKGKGEIPRALTSPVSRRIVDDGFKHRLGALRKALRLTQRELADMVHVHDSYISLLESGGREPGPKALSALAATLGETEANLAFGLQATFSPMSPEEMTLAGVEAAL